MHTRSQWPIVAAALLLTSFPLLAAPPLAVVVGSANLTTGSELNSTPSVELEAGADFDWRAAFADTAYFAVWSSARIFTYPFAGLTVSDRESLGLELGATPAGVSLSACSSVTATTGLFNEPAQAEPEWMFRADVPLGEDRYLGGSYSGSYRWSDADSDDRLENRFSLLLVSEPSFAVSWTGTLTGGYDFFPEAFLDATGGAVTADRRHDLLVSASLSADILARYFTRWNADLSAGYRASNATRYLPETNVLEPQSEDRLFASAAGRLSRSPSSALSVTVAGSSDAAIYLGRAAVAENGVPLDENLAYLRATLGLEVAWSPGGTVYLVGSVSGAGALANDPLYSGWSATGGLSVQWRL